MRFLVPAAICAALLLVAGGCGSSSDSGTTAAATTTTAATTPLPTGTTTAKTSTTAILAAHKKFLKRVNPICEDYNRDAQEAQKRLLATEKQIKGEGNVDAYVGPLKFAAAAAHRASDRFAAQKAPAAEAAAGRADRSRAQGTGEGQRPAAEGRASRRSCRSSASRTKRSSRSSRSSSR